MLFSFVLPNLFFTIYTAASYFLSPITPSYHTSRASSPRMNNETLILVAGGLFHPADDKQEIAFRYAVEKINSDRSILPRSKLSAQIEKIPPQDSFHASKKGEFCQKSLVSFFVFLKQRKRVVSRRNLVDCNRK